MKTETRVYYCAVNKRGGGDLFSWEFLQSAEAVKARLDEYIKERRADAHKYGRAFMFKPMVIIKRETVDTFDEDDYFVSRTITETAVCKYPNQIII